MQNAWRFVDDEVLRERLKEAKGIGTPATRAEIIGGLKKQGFLVAQGKHIVPTEAGLSLFGVLKQADPALVDPGVTAQLECLLDDVVVGKQEMIGAIDAVCNVAERIIGKLKEGGTAGGAPLLGAAVGNGPGTFPPTPAMKRFADSLVRQKGIKPPPGYKTSISICRKFLNEPAPKKAEGETPGKPDSEAVSPAQMLYAKKIAQGKGVVIPEEVKANSAALSAWIDSNRSAKCRRRGGRKTAHKPAGSGAPRSVSLHLAFGASSVEPSCEGRRGTGEQTDVCTHSNKTCPKLEIALGERLLGGEDAGSSPGLYYPRQRTFDGVLNFFVTGITKMTECGGQVSWPDENPVHAINCKYLG
jgi:DNA topoisomerase III